MKQTKLLIILDGWGHSEATENNAIAIANTPNWDHFLNNYPHTLLGTSGIRVGFHWDKWETRKLDTLQ